MALTRSTKNTFGFYSKCFGAATADELKEWLKGSDDWRPEVSNQAPQLLEGGAASDRTHIKDRDPPPGYDAMMMLLPEDGGKLSPPLWITDVAPPPAYAAAIQMGGSPPASEPHSKKQHAQPPPGGSNGSAPVGGSAQAAAARAQAPLSNHAVLNSGNITSTDRWKGLRIGLPKLIAHTDL